ncbi:hypothetical protein MG293_002987 [Ovis ammon polii]|uniref:Uncharacterized protein n=1 Tax=Ovis ammon polii TaxID=230172 RepID=A0AAD4YGH4_OVIAM|nr:hypothetical protein MG293_002987 [Ovis ammon polii]KAI4576665.1 hypothetical protein MJT46_002500 [Ovis ammon polii x Ovis aries]
MPGWKKNIPICLQAEEQERASLLICVDLGVAWAKEKKSKCTESLPYIEHVCLTFDEHYLVQSLYMPVSSALEIQDELTLKMSGMNKADKVCRLRTVFPTDVCVMKKTSQCDRNCGYLNFVNISVTLDVDSEGVQKSRFPIELSNI